MADDIDQFIQEQKKKLARDRNSIQNGDAHPVERSSSGRKTWDRETRPELDKQIEQGRRQRPPPTPEETGLNFGAFDYEKKRKKLQQQRQQEYNELLAKTSHPAQKTDMQEEQGLALGRYENQRRKLQEERNREMREQMAKGGAGRNGFIDTQRKENIPPPRLQTPEVGIGAQLGGYERTKKKLDEERKKEYNDMIAQKQGYSPRGPSVPPWLQTSPRYKEEKTYRSTGRITDDAGNTLPGLRNKESADKEKIRTRNAEYNEFLKQKEASKGGRGGQYEESRRDQPRVTFDDDSRHRDDRNSRRHDDYDDYDYSPRDRPPRDYARDSHSHSESEVYDGKTLPGLKDRASAEQRKVSERNREYNDFLRQKEGGRRRRDERVPSRGRDDFLSDEEEDYRRLRDRPPRKGWGTPTYEEILEQKRKEESRYRRYDDPEFSRGRLGGDTYLRNSISDGHLNDDRRLRDLDREYEAKKARYRDDRERDRDRPGNRYRDEDPVDAFYKWLNKTKLKYEDTYQDRSRRDRDSYEVDYDRSPRREERPRNTKQNTRQVSPPPAKRQTQNQGQASGGTTLLVGHEDSTSAKRSKQERYRQELEIQMQEAKAAKQREKQEGEKLNDMRVNATGAQDPEKRPDRLRDLPPSEVPGQRRAYESRPVQPYHTVASDLSPRSEAFRKYKDDLFEPRQAPSILEAGFGALYSQPRHEPSLLEQAAGLYNGKANLGPYNSPADEAYYYYGSRNPLDGDPRLGGVGGRDPDPRGYEPSAPRRQTPPGRGQGQGRSPRQPEVGAFPSGEDPGRAKSRVDKQSYQQELQQQMEEKRRQKERAKEEEERYNRKMEAEIANYNPFGKGGGGAPIKDREGNIVADLKKMHRTNEDPTSPRYEPPPRAPDPYQPGPSYEPTPGVNQQYNLSPRNDGEPSYGRGQSDIYGEKKEEPKAGVDKYKLDLQKQIEEKKRKQEEEKAKIRAEEEKEMKRIEEQRVRMQQEYEAELAKAKAKEEEARLKNEEIKRVAEEKRKEAERRRKEQEEQRSQELRERQERERKQRELDKMLEERGRLDRSNSPPVPTLKHQLEENGEPVGPFGERSNSPPIPTLQNKSKTEVPSTSSRSERSLTNSPPVPAKQTEIRAQSADVLNTLAAMRRQLQSERKRVENALENQKYDVDVFDPRTARQGQSEAPAEVFEVKCPVTVRRTPTADTANAKPLQEFNDLKYRQNTESRQQFRSIFPEVPATNDALETQQIALLRAQEDKLEQMRKIDYDTRSEYDIIRSETADLQTGPCTPSTGPSDDPYARQPYIPSQRDLDLIREESTELLDSRTAYIADNLNPKELTVVREESRISAAMLDSESAFIDVDNNQRFPDDLEDLARVRKDSARERRRRARDESPPRRQLDNVSLESNPMGSTTSIDPDRITRKNQERLRRLRNLAGDEISMADPDDVLDRFMAKQNHTRPPSGNTLRDDSWLRPGTKDSTR